MQSQRLEGARVLVAEDNAILAFEIMGILCHAGAEIVGPARTLADALVLAESPSLSCALIDIDLQGCAVFPAARKLIERRINTIFHSAHSDLESVKREWPAAGILPKPATRERLIEAVHSACFGHAATLS
jgi:DNA-binding NarL/FixJ family response regulator